MTDTIRRVSEDQRALPKKARWRTMLFFALLISLGLVATGVLPVQQYLGRGVEVDTARTRLAELEAENERLSAEAEALLTETEIERIAREEYGYVRPGEVGYTVVGPDLDEPVVKGPAAPAEPISPFPTERGFFQKIWDFITGRDIADDG